MYIAVVFIPLMSALIVGFFGRYLGRKGSAIFSTSSIVVSFLLSVFIFCEVALGGSRSNIKLFSWFESGLLANSWGFLFDTVTAVMLIVVTCVSCLVHLYSTSYMGEDPHLVRFMSYLSLFTFFMLSLVTADNYAQMFLGWEGVGLASYLLINFWYTRTQANKAAIKAIIVNRVGDFGLALGLLGVFFVFRSLDFNVVFPMVYAMKDYSLMVLGYEFNAITAIGLLLFLGAVGKSAQLGLHTWLPDAMEGPTPVSALIHAATMVTAGVFVLIRSSPLLEYSSTALVVITVVGALTAFFAGTVGAFQNDLKRVIAYSTCSQLGYMVFACGLSNYGVGMFHLMNHAFFKALLFLSAGSVIHALMDEQDMRRMGGLFRVVPYTFVMVMIGSLALMGFPFTTGFYSKDVILELAFVNYYVEGIFAYWLGVVAAFFTAFYSFRLIYMTFLGETNSTRRIISGAHDAPLAMAVPLFVLCLGSIFVGYICKDMFIGMGTDFWGNSVFHFNVLGDVLVLESEYLDSSIKNLPVAISIFGGLLALVLYSNYPKAFYLVGKPLWLRDMYVFFNKKWYFDIVYNRYIVNKVLEFGYEITFKKLDRGAIELIGPTGLVRIVKSMSEGVHRFQSGFIYHYVYVMVVGLGAALYLVGISGQLVPVSLGVSLLFVLLILYLVFNKGEKVEEK